MNWFSHAAFALLLLLVHPGAARSQDSGAAKVHAPEQVAATLHVREGYEVTLVAAEPLVQDPVAVRFDQRGRLWVVEMPDYPTGPRDGAEPAGRVRILTDDNGDGRFDSTTTFADGLLFATGVQPYRDGAFITLAGSIAYFADTDGDGVADRREVWFEGFATENEQLRANHPTLGPDGLIYVANGLRGGSIVAADGPFDARSEPLDLRTRDFCFDPEGGLWTAVAGNSQFGLTIDDYGRRVGCSNRNPAMFPPLGLDAIDRDPLLSPRDAITDIAAAADRSRVVPIADAWTTSNLHAGQFSAACGTIAPGVRSASGEWLFVCEPTGSLVQRQSLVREQSIWKSEREPHEEEFLASTDVWFRPVDLTIGPHGELFVVDMARAVIEHPDWVPQELKDRGDTWDGAGLGRLFRVHTPGAETSWTPITSAADALAALQSTTPLERELASQYFLEQGLEPSIDRLRELLRDADNPATRARVAQLLRRFDRLTGELWSELLVDSEPRVRALAVQLAEPAGEVIFELTPLADDPDPLVRRQLARTLAAVADLGEEASGALLAVAERDAQDPWMRRTIGSIHSDSVVKFLQPWLSRPSFEAGESDLAAHLIRRFARRDPSSAAETLMPRLREASQPGGTPDLPLLLRAWAQGVRDGKSSVAEQLAKLPSSVQRSLESALDTTIAAAADDETKLRTRLVAIELAALAGQAPESYRELLAAEHPPQIRAAVIPVLVRADGAWTLEYLESHLGSMTHPLRKSVVDACLQSPDRTGWLLTRIEQGDFAKTILDPATANRLRSHRDDEIRQRARDLLAPDANRQEVLQAYATAARVDGDTEAGKQLFKQHCSACHRIDEIGTNVGPDISDSRTKTPESLLEAILDPNAAIDAAYLRYSVLTDDGRILEGLLVDETADAVTLAQQEGERVSVPREQIEQLQAPGVSLMPDGFESVINVDQMRDLITYLKNWRYLDRDIPLSPTQ